MTQGVCEPFFSPGARHVALAAEPRPLAADRIARSRARGCEVSDLSPRFTVLSRAVAPVTRVSASPFLKFADLFSMIPVPVSVATDDGEITCATVVREFA